ncbi:MAG: FG-GAP repeat protein, partial [Methylococcaceae bacterium]
MNKNSNKLYRYISILCFLYCLSPAILAKTQKQIQLDETPQGLSTYEWGGIQQQINTGQYRAHSDTKGGYRASNLAQGWHIHYAAEGTTTLTPRNNQAKPYHLGMKLSAIGYQTLQLLHKPQQISQQDFTISYQWNANVRERWINSEQQLEQWFDIEKRPKGAEKGHPLTVQMTLDSELKITQNGNNIQFSNTKGLDITYNKLKVWDSTGKELPARMQLASNTLSLLVDDSTARYPLTIDPRFQQRAYLKASNTDSSDVFGLSVSISGDTLVVGAFGESSNSTGVNGNQSDNSAKDSGAAYVFIRRGSTWVQQAYLKASNTESGDLFGISVAISGDTVVVGAEGEKSNSSGVNGNQNNNSIKSAGAAYVFTRRGGTWAQQAYLKSSNPDANDLFGNTVAISGESLVIGALLEDSNSTGLNGNKNDNSAKDSGAAYVFIRSGSTWTQQAYLKASNTDAGDIFSSSVAISANTLVVGSEGESSNSNGVNGDQSDNSANYSGAAYVFTRNGSTWTQQAYLKASNTSILNSFGNSVAISGGTLTVGAPGESSDSTGVNGDQSNNSILTSSGAAYVFTRMNSIWAQQAFLKASNTGFNDQFGESIAISGDMLVVGAINESSNSTGVNGDQSDNSREEAGAAYVFSRSGSIWSQQAYLKASTIDFPDEFGISVALSGNSLVMGAQGEDSSSTGVNGDQTDNSAQAAGAAYVFEMTNVRPLVESLSIPIQAVTDDAEENLNDGDVSLFSSDLELIQDELKPQVVGLRFPLSIPAGATILKATLQFTADETSSIPTNLVVSAEATAHALTFADLDSDISNRPLISTSIPWTPPAWSLKGEAGPDQQTPDLSTLIQELVDYGDWGQGNSIAFIISGNGIREAESFDGTAPPVLHVTFENESPAEMSYSIGDIGPGGGIVFYTSNEGLNGLEVALEN